MNKTSILTNFNKWRTKWFKRKTFIFSSTKVAGFFICLKKLQYGIYVQIDVKNSSPGAKKNVAKTVIVPLSTITHYIDCYTLFERKVAHAFGIKLSNRNREKKQYRK